MMTGELPTKANNRPAKRPAIGRVKIQLEKTSPRVFQFKVFQPFLFIKPTAAVAPVTQ